VPGNVQEWCPVSVQKTTEGTWRARIRNRGGKQLSKTFKLKADAQAWERSQLKLRDDGQHLVASRLTVSEWADQWLASARNLAPSTVLTYRKALDVILPTLGDVRLSDLTPERIDAFLTADALEYAPSTVHRHYRTIKRLCSTAVRRGHLTVNPVNAVDPPKVPRTEMRFLTAEQVEAIADAMQPRYRAWVLVAGYGGLRWGEMQALRPDHVNGNELTVLEQLSGELKTDGSRRRVVLPTSVGAELAAHMATYPGEFVFTRPDGSALGHAAFNNNQFKPALKRAGVDSEVTLHTLRHTAIALWIQAGGHPKLVADMAGHSSIVVTMDRYGHLFPAMHGDVAAKVDELRQGL
jgi:integrase